MQAAYDLKVCPDCERLLLFWKGTYLCQNCCKTFLPAETIDHPRPEGFCRFIEKIAEAGHVFICFNCGKTIFSSLEEMKVFTDRMDNLFSEDYIQNRRKEIQDFIDSWMKGIGEAEERDRFIKAIKQAEPGDTLTLTSSTQVS